MPRIELRTEEVRHILGAEGFQEFVESLPQIGGGAHWVFYLEWDRPPLSGSQTQMEHHANCMKSYKAIVAFSDGGSRSQMIALNCVPELMWNRELDAWSVLRGGFGAPPKPKFKAAWGVS